MANKDVLVLYHHGGGCLDGFSSAAVLWDYFTTPMENGNSRLGINQEICFQACDYGDPIPDLANKVVFIVDFSFDPEKLVEAAKAAISVTLLDHHATALRQWIKYDESLEDTIHMERIEENTHGGNVINQFVAGNVTATFATQMAGSVLTWRYLYVQFDQLANNDEQPPLLLRYCQDWDLHTLKLEGVKEIASALYAKPWIRELRFEEFIRLLTSIQLEEDANAGYHKGKLRPASSYFTDSDSLKELSEEGKIIYDYQVTMAHAMIARGVRYVSVTCPATGKSYVNIPALAVPRELRTIAGGIMSKGHPFSITYEDYFPIDVREYSFRSDKDDPNSVDVEVLAVAFGGGGHRAAAGVRMSTHAVRLWDW